MNGVIYLIRNPLNYIYIGQTKNFEKRMESYAKLECVKQKLLYKSLKRYGFHKHSVSIILQCPIESLDREEIRLINEYKSCYRDSPLGLNILKESYEEYCKIRSTLPPYKQFRVKKRIQQVNPLGEIVKIWVSLLDIIKTMKYSQNLLETAIRKKTYYRGYKWKYIK